MKKRFLLILLSVMFLTSISASSALAVLIDDFDDGDLAGWSVGGIADASSGAAVLTGWNSYLSQDTGYDFVDGATYTFSADITGGSFLVVLKAGSTYATSYGSTSTFTYTADSADAGENIVLYLMSKNSDGRTTTAFDNVFLASAAIDGGGATMNNPIPAPILLLGTGLVGLAGFRRKVKK